MDTNSDIQDVVLYFTRIYYETISNRHVPISLKQLILQFAARLFNSLILSYSQDAQILNLLSKLHIVIQPKLLYRASDHLFNKNKFHQLCDNHGPTITIIQSQNNNIFGAYADVKWPKYTPRRNKTFTIRTSKDICLFLIQSNDADQDTPIMMHSTNYHNYIASNPDTGPVIGSGRNKQFMELYIDNPYHQSYTYRSTGFDYSAMNCNHSNLSGTNPLQNNAHNFALLDYEVFDL